MNLDVTEDVDCSALDLARLRRALEEEFGTRIDGTVSLALVNNRTIAGLNQQFLGHEGPTDVLSFPLKDESDPDPEDLFGEVVVSLEMAEEESAARSIPRFEETLRYCVHGLLHLLGYDDRAEGASQEMVAEQERIVSRSR